MPVFLVATSLQDPEQTSNAVDAALSSLDACVRPFPGIWIVEAPLSAMQIETLLEPCLRSNDRLLVSHMGHEARWRNVAADADAWMQESFKMRQWGSAPP